MSRITLSLLLVSTTAIGLAGCPKVPTLAKSSLEATAPLTITFEGDISQCDDHACLIGFAEKVSGDSDIAKLGDEGRLVRLFGDGSYRIFKKGEAAEKPEQEEPPENWQETPEKDPAYWDAMAEEKVMGNAIEEVAKGNLGEVDGKKVVEIAADQLPATDFVLYSNGHFGAMFDGEQLSSPEGFGVVKLAR